MEDFEKNYNRVLRFLSFRPRSKKEILDYLNKKKVSEEVAKKIIKKLLEYKFLDDFEFAKMWIAERTKLKPRALRIIKNELKQKGISQENLESIIQNEELQIPSDFQMAFTLAQKRLKKYKNLSKREFFEKMGRYLASKGFNYETIKKVVSRF
ncbi:MAG: hypothetical protein A2W22_06705 [Candidatus Levybacteria bacterium RBG_16_35_11]|nr:MAG: hypothetical protein A2W22_06705 [Candidatus Levybacteria bacterium RBG_16_35_11]